MSLRYIVLAVILGLTFGCTDNRKPAILLTPKSSLVSGVDGITDFIQLREILFRAQYLYYITDQEHKIVPHYRFNHDDDKLMPLSVDESHPLHISSFAIFPRSSECGYTANIRQKTSSRWEAFPLDVMEKHRLGDYVVLVFDDSGIKQ